MSRRTQGYNILQTVYSPAKILQATEPNQQSQSTDGQRGLLNVAWNIYLTNFGMRRHVSKLKHQAGIHYRWPKKS